MNFEFEGCAATSAGGESVIFGRGILTFDLVLDSHVDIGCTFDLLAADAEVAF